MAKPIHVIRASGAGRSSRLRRTACGCRIVQALAEPLPAEREILEDMKRASG